MHLCSFFLVKKVAIYALLVCKFFGHKIRSCKFFDKYQVCFHLPDLDKIDLIFPKINQYFHNILNILSWT